MMKTEEVSLVFKASSWETATESNFCLLSSAAIETVEQSCFM